MRGWTEATEVHAGEERDEATPTGPPVAARVRDRGQELRGLPRVHGDTATRRPWSPGAPQRSGVAQMDDLKGGEMMA